MSKPSPARPKKPVKKPTPDLQLVGIRRGFFPTYIKDLHRIVATGLGDHYNQLTDGSIAVRIEVQEEDEAVMPSIEGVAQIMLVYSPGGE